MTHKLCPVCNAPTHTATQMPENCYVDDCPNCGWHSGLYLQGDGEEATNQRNDNMNKLYMICTLNCDHDPACIVCKGVGFIPSGLTIQNVARYIASTTDTMADHATMAKHMDRYWELHQPARDEFIDWLRQNPYPKR